MVQLYLNVTGLRRRKNVDNQPQHLVCIPRHAQIKSYEIREEHF